jgi:hypothetical protein
VSIKVTVKVEVDDPKAKYSIKKKWEQNGNGNPLFNSYLIEGGIVAAGQDVLALVERLQGDIRLTGRPELERTIPRRPK